MKKKFVVLCFFIALLPLVIFASIDFSYDFNPGRSLFEEPKADPYSLSTSLKYITVTEGQPNEILASKHSGREDAEIVMVPWTDANDSNVNYYNLKSGVDLAFSRLTLGPVSIELNLGGGLNTVFEGFGGSNCIGFDGLYFYGLNASFFDVIQLKAGYHHFSGHWGDEINDKYYERLREYTDYVNGTKIYQTTEYTRDNSMLFGISVTPASFLRFYGKLEIPKKASWLHPVTHLPNDTVRPTDGDNQMEHLGEKYGIKNIIKADGYHAYRIQAGVGLEVPIYKKYSYFLSYDFQSHQDGQTMHNLEDYSPNNPWEIENTISTGISMKHVVRDVRIEFTYHDGRFPLLNMYYQRTKYWSLGLNISG